MIMIVLLFITTVIGLIAYSLKYKEIYKKDEKGEFILTKDILQRSIHDGSMIKVAGGEKIIDLSAVENNKILKIFKLGFICVAPICWGIFLIFCLNQVSPGEVGIVVNMMGDEKGVEPEEKTVGIHFVAPWKKMYIFPIFEQNHQWTDDDKFTFQTSEGLPVTSEIGITYHLEPNKVPQLFCRYRRGMQEITHLFVRNNLRNYLNAYASKMKIEDLIGNKKEDFFRDVHKSVQKELNHLGFIITNVYMIGQFDVPQNVKAALNEKIAATQRAQQRENELRESEAQARKLVAESEGTAKSKIVEAKAAAETKLMESRANAEANSLLTKSITRELLEWNSINKWDGKMPYAMGGQSMPFMIQIPNGGK